MTSVIYKKYSVLGSPRYWNRRKKNWIKWLCKSCHYKTHKGAWRVLNSPAFYRVIDFNSNKEYGVTSI